MSSSRLLALALLVAALCLLSAAPSAAQTSVYFYYASAPQTPPYMCTTGVLSCTLNAGTSNNFTCQSTVSGTHYYYPSSTGPTFVSNLLTGSQSTVCELYTSDGQLPLTGNGLNIAYGSTSQPVCVNLRIDSGVPTADPDAQAGTVTFNYSTTNNLPSCPAANPATSTASATVTFVYTSTAPASSGYTNVCGTGTLSCTSYGNNQYFCPTLLSGTEYRYNYSTNSLSTTALTGIVECNGFGDGYLPLDYEGISFALATPPSFLTSANCTSWYGEGTTAYGFDYYAGNGQYVNTKGNKSFTYSTTPQTASAACSATIPAALTGGAAQLMPLSLALLSLLLALTIAAFTLA